MSSFASEQSHPTLLRNAPWLAIAALGLGATGATTVYQATSSSPPSSTTATTSSSSTSPIASAEQECVSEQTEPNLSEETGESGKEEPSEEQKEDPLDAPASDAADENETSSAASPNSGQTDIPEDLPEVNVESEVNLLNWAGTHGVTASWRFAPESVSALEDLVRRAHAARQALRPVGTALSPNGLAFQRGGMVGLEHLDAVGTVDRERMEVTVQAGATVAQVLARLKQEGLTLQNFSSIQEQQIGGWTQVAAHGTGARLPTVDEMITRMEIITPALGKLTLSDTQNAALFRFAKVGLGSLGVVSQVTLKCIPQHRLHERTFVVDDYDTLRRGHAERLKRFRHVRYMWLPYTGSVVVVVSDPVDDTVNDVSSVVRDYETPTGAHTSANSAGQDGDDAALPLKQLLTDRRGLAADTMKDMSFADLRGELLDAALDDVSDDELGTPTQIQKELAWTRRVNEAEANYWRRAAGERVADSTEVLGFECGGSQWVLETAFPCGTLDEPNLKDLDFVQQLIEKIEEHGIAAPCPIEQRWTARSASYLSPAYSEDPNEIFSWVGIIMYLPNMVDSESPDAVAVSRRRNEITRRFQSYAQVKNDLVADYGGFPHWSKIEVGGYGLDDNDDNEEGTDPSSSPSADALRQRYAQRFPVAAFETIRSSLDPHGILLNHIVEAVLPPKRPTQS